MEAHASGLWQQRRPLQATNMSDLVDEASAASPHGCDNGALTDRFGVLIQGLLAVVAFSTLMCKSAVERIGTKKKRRGSLEQRSVKLPPSRYKSGLFRF